MLPHARLELIQSGFFVLKKYFCGTLSEV